MGLSISFELRLPGDTPLAMVDAIVADLYRTARALPFPVARRMAWHHRSHDAFLAAMIGVPAPGERFRRKPLDGTARGILVELGHQCDLAILAFLYCVDDGGTRREWRWRGDCQTQRAATVSDEDFLARHTALIALFDRAVALGVGVTVHDEGDYWLTRDRARLLQRVRGLARAMGRDVC